MSTFRPIAVFSPICPFCLFPSSGRASLRRIWAGYLQSRSLSQLRKKAPSRMTLSPKVAQRSPAPPKGRTSNRNGPSPFAGMNRTSAGLRETPRTASSARSSREGTRAKRDAKKPVTKYKALKMQRSLSAVTYDRRTKVKESIQEIHSFEDFPLLPVVQESVASQALAGLKDIAPTPVQRVSIPALLGVEEGRHRRKASKEVGERTAKMEHFLIAAETGSGKTLAYLLPVVDAIKRAEAVDAENDARAKALKESQPKENVFELDPPPLSDQPHVTTGRPRAIILLPTSELVTQVGRVMKLLSHRVKYRSAVISAADSGRVIRNRLFSPNGIDMLVSTPHLLASVAEGDPNILSRVTHLVIDEADSLLDRSFSPTTSAIIDRATPSLKQLILCSATIPRSLDSYLRERYPDIKRLVTPNLHAIPRRVQLGVVDVAAERYRGNKSLACADTIYSIGKAAADRTSTVGEVDQAGFDLKRVLVFVNERSKAQEVAEYLVAKGIDAAALHRDTSEQRQAEILSAFTNINPPSSTAGSNDATGKNEAIPDARRYNYIPSDSKRSLPNTKVLITTDLGSRGIDTVAVRHVILYDVPHTSIDFIHRLGRTGRMGRRGRGIVLVAKDDRKDIVREVREGMFKGQALI